MSWLVNKFVFLRTANVQRKPQFISEILNYTLDHNFNGIVSGFTSQLSSFSNNYYRRGVLSLRMMEQKIGFKPLSFLFIRNNWLIPEYNEIIRRLRDAGILEFWNSFYIRREKPDEFGPEVLTLSHLELCFYACMIPLAMSIIAFVCELYSELITYFYRKLKRQIWRSLMSR